MIFHQPRFPWNKGISLPDLPFGDPGRVFGRSNLTRIHDPKNEEQNKSAWKNDKIPPKLAQDIFYQIVPSLHGKMKKTSQLTRDPGNLNLDVYEDLSGVVQCWRFTLWSCLRPNGDRVHGTKMLLASCDVWNLNKHVAVLHINWFAGFLLSTVLLPWKPTNVHWKSMVGSDVFPTEIVPFYFEGGFYTCPVYPFLADRF